MISSRNISRVVVASIYSVSLFAISCACLVAGDLWAQNVTRGPYLQLGTPSSVVVRWRTSVATTGRVRYGNDPANLTGTVDAVGSSTDHSVTLSGLAADTRYYYSVGTTTAVLASGSDYKFVTSPPGASSKPMRIWVIGDAGTGTSSQTSVRDAYSTFNGARETDLWLVLGDNAYDSGTDAEYQARHFGIYPSMLRSSVSWYTLGNHDAITGPVNAHPYHDMFTLPTAAEAGGVSSGTENYYSFNYGNVHFISLDSQDTSRAANGAMATWLASDLTNNTLPWVIAFWHHPPYSKGSHDSDTEINLVEMRTNMLPILEQHGVDLVLSGHSHVYERSYLLDGHYGLSSTLTPAMKKNAGDGRTSGNGAYQKPSIGPAPHEGAVYVVAGSSGQTSGFNFGSTHPAMYISLNNLGSLVLDLNGETLDVTFLRENATAADTFRLIKGSVSGNVPPDAAITSPANGATFAGPSSIALTATASDGNGSVSQVTYYDGATLLGTASANPYSVAWNNPPLGNHRLTARATDNNGAVHVSAPVFVTVNAVAPPTPPAAPSNLKASGVTATKVSLTWVDKAVNESSYQVERAVNSGAFVLLATLGANAVSFDDTAVSPAAKYGYRVRATNSGGTSAYSNSVTATTPDLPPGAPSLLSATAVGPRQINLHWTAGAGNETGFEIERSTDGGVKFSRIKTVAANTTSFANTGLTANRTYYYRVRATNNVGVSTYSNVDSATTPLQ